MKYFVLLATESDAGPWDKLTPEQQQAEMEKHGAFSEGCNAQDGVEIVGGEALEYGSMATTLRTRNGEMTVTDGPFAEAAEQIGGFYLVEAPDIDTLVDLCKLLPSYDIEVRPVQDIG